MQCEPLGEWGMAILPNEEYRLADRSIPKTAKGIDMKDYDTAAQGEVREDYALPVCNRVPDGVRKGRNVREGYSRGWRLQFGDLRAKIVAYPLYREALALAEGRTILSEENRTKVFLLIKLFLRRMPMGHIVEFGPSEGGNAVLMPRVCSAVHPEMRVLALGTLKVMPETDSEIDAHRAGGSSDADYDEMRNIAASLGLANLEFVRGLLEETAPKTLQRVGGI